MVVVNLYPFEAVIAKADCTLEDAIENIDIGGVALLRAAAKNYRRVTVLSAPQDYPQDLNTLNNEHFRQKMARKAFSLTARYDFAIQNYFAALEGKAETLNLRFYPVQTLRYGENPHQRAVYYAENPNASPMGGKLLQGKPLSYNNLLDLDSAWNAVLNFDAPTVVVVKHLSPCGIASAPRVAMRLRPPSLAIPSRHLAV